MKIFSKQKWKDDVMTWDIQEKTKMHLINCADDGNCWVTLADGKDETWLKNHKMKMIDEWMIEKGN